MSSLVVLPYITFVTAENFVYAVFSLVKSWQQYVTILCLFLVAQSYPNCPFFCFICFLNLFLAQSSLLLHVIVFTRCDEIFVCVRFMFVFSLLRLTGYNTRHATSSVSHSSIRPSISHPAIVSEL